MILSDNLCRRALAAVVSIVFLAAALPATAQHYILELEPFESRAIPLNDPDPQYPGGTVRRGQEGWVRMNFVVTPDGRAVEPIIIDSVGGSGFEHEAREVLDRWQFQPAEEGFPSNMVDIRWEIRLGKDAATSNFIRRYKRIVTDLHYEATESARKQVDDATELGGWNLYESVMLWLMVGRVDGAEGDLASKLESYRRALGVSTSESLFGDDKCELLRKIFEMEMERGQYASAARTLATLKRVPGNTDDLQMLADKIRMLEDTMDSDETMTARGKLYTACNCQEGVPIWSYRPARREFSFSSLEGEVARFEARCDSGRMSGAVTAGKSWNLPAEWGSCRIFVFGEDNASFDFLEHGIKDSDVVTEDAAVARSNVLD